MSELCDTADVVGRVHMSAFYRCRNGVIVGPMIDDGRDPSFGYAAALGGEYQETWYSDGWSAGHGRDRDLVAEVKPPLTWDGFTWHEAALK
jgi:hypothetical protein